MKRNYSELKLIFFASEEQEVKVFFQKNYNTWNGTLAKKTTGRKKEKEAYKEKVFNKALENKEAELTKRTEARLLKIDNIYYKIVSKLENKLEDENINIPELFTLRKIVRTEKNLPINITKYDPQEQQEINKNKNNPEEIKRRLEIEAEHKKEDRINEEKARIFDNQGNKLDEEIIN